MYERGFPGEPADVTLRYRVVRIWPVPPEHWLAGGLGVLPLAPLGAVREAELPAVLARMKERVDREATRSQATEFWSATYILMGVRYEQALIDRLLQGVLTMEESVTYQAILRKGEAKGEAKEARRILLLLGREMFGEPQADVQAALDALSDVRRLEELAVRLRHVSGWQELLAMND
jgi:predicted transposase YdaD